jgi:cyclophilin family peptidyl-prolyl cis-trans isomerase
MGTVSGSGSPVSLHAGFDSAPAASFVDVSSLVGSGGNFFINEAQLFQISGGTLLNSAFHTLHLQATDNQGHVASFDVPYTIQIAPPTQPTLHLDTTSDPHQMGITMNPTATLQGQTSNGAQVVLSQNGTTLATTTADNTGAFSFANINLAFGANNYTVQATDNAGNASQLQTFFVRETGPVAVPTSPVHETATVGSTDTFVDLSSPLLFTDGNFSNSLIRMNTSAGPINVQLFDTGAPQTVTNFFDYINATTSTGTVGAYTNDIFHRLVTNFVLQGGGFTFDPNGHTITPVTAGPNVPNEFDNTNRPNVLGTIAMAKLSDPNSATSQFFFNLADNTNTLGSSNSGGFTVFGRVVSGADQRVINTLAAATVTDQSNSNSAFGTLPLNNYSGSNFPTDTTTANYDLINNMQVLQRTDQLTFSILSNSAPNVATGSFTFGQFQIHAISTGTTNIVVQAMDRFGHTATVTFSVTV